MAGPRPCHYLKAESEREDLIEVIVTDSPTPHQAPRLVHCTALSTEQDFCDSSGRAQQPHLAIKLLQLCVRSARPGWGVKGCRSTLNTFGVDIFGLHINDLVGQKN